MRPGQQQQNKRMRGRGNRKGPNPLSRSFESNGPDVKIRGTAQHIADKYTTLARDAAASGDRVMAENYLQHAEHYGRIVAAAQGQFQPSQPERDYGDLDEDDIEDGAGPETGGNQPYAGDRNQGGQNNYGNGERSNNNADRPNFRENRDNNNQPRGERRDGRNENRGDRPFENRGDRPYQNRDNRDGYNRDRDGQNRDGQNRDGQGQGQPREFRDRSHQPGTGPQPFVRDEAEGVQPQRQDAPRQDGQRQEGGRREGRRERPRLNERSGERRFEERFSRHRPSEDQVESSASVAEATTGAVQGENVPSADTATAPKPEAAPNVSAVEPAVAVHADNAEPRRRGRPRRDVPTGDVTAELPSPSTDSPATISASADPVEPAPAPVSRRRTSKPAPVEAEAAVQPAASGEGEVKRRPGRPRKKKTDEEGGDESTLPAFLLASNS